MITEIFKSKTEAFNFLKENKITFDKIILMIEKLNSYEVIYRG